MVNGCKTLYRAQRQIDQNESLSNDDAVLRIIDKIIMPLGRRIEADSPTVDARLPDGSRVNAVINRFPLMIIITIRKFQKDKLSIDQLIELIDYKNMADLAAYVVSRLNIIISGGTGSGKTTLLNVLSAYMPREDARYHRGRCN